MPLGKNALMYNYHWIFDFETIVNIFDDWELRDFFIDEWAGFPGITSYFDAKALGISSINLPVVADKQIERFSRNYSIENLDIGHYKIIYLHFKGKKRNQ